MCVQKRRQKHPHADERLSAAWLRLGFSFIKTELICIFDLKPSQLH